MNNIGSYEDSHAADLNTAERMVRLAIEQIETVHARWREAEANPQSSIAERSERLRILNLQHHDFAIQWANVKFCLEAVDGHLAEVNTMLSEIHKRLGIHV